jgi:hypothetical protein
MISDNPTVRRMNMRCLLILTLLFVFWPAAAGAQNFDYYVFTLSWSPEFCHENPSNHSDECSANAEGKFVVHGSGRITMTAAIRETVPRRRTILPRCLRVCAQSCRATFTGTNGKSTVYARA